MIVKANSLHVGRDMKPLLYIHIGFPKTGTSTIQKFCFENRDHLKEKGIYYPAPLGTPVFSGHTGHLDISEKTAALFQGRVPWKKCLNRYLSDMLQAKCKINILSSEGLASDNPKNLELFRKEFDVRIVCFFRNIFDFLSSHEKQVVKDGLRCDFFANLRHRNTCFLYAVDQYVKFFGIENCIFLNYDRITKEGNILDSFFRSLNTDIDIDKYTFTKENITPPDAAMMFFYQLSFLPFVRWEWNTLRNEIFQMDFSSWKSYRCTLLPSFVFSLDDAAKRALLRQGELLHDTNWYDYTLARGKKLAAIETHDLPLEIQHDIWGKLSDAARAAIIRHWPKAGTVKPGEPILPSLENIRPDLFDQMRILRRGYTTCLGNFLREKQKNDSLMRERERERERERDAGRRCFQHCRVPSSPDSARASLRLFPLRRVRPATSGVPVFLMSAGILSVMLTLRRRVSIPSRTMSALGRKKAAIPHRGSPRLPICRQTLMWPRAP